MSGYYRTIFAIGKGDAPSSQIIGDAWRCVRNWVAEEYGDPYRSSEQRGAWEGVNGELRLYDRALNDMRLCNLVWTRADADASGSRWRLSLRLATDGDGVEADIEVRGMEGDGGEPLSELTARPPSVLGQLVERFECSIGDDLLQTAAKRIGVDESDAFVRDEILSESRRMPLLVVTDFRQGGNAVDANELQRELVGLARVFAYNHNTAWNIARDLSQSLWCYDGAVRLYAPGCSEDGISQQHPYWLPHDVNRLKWDNRLWQMLRDECVNRMPRQGQGRLYSRVREQIRTQELQDMEARSEQDEESQVLDLILSTSDLLDGEDKIEKRIYDMLMKRVHGLRYRKERLIAEKQELEYEKKELERENAQLKREIRKYESGGVAPQMARFSSVLEVVECAAGELTHLRFVPNAFETAESAYTKDFDTRADAIFRALTVLNECAKQRVRPESLQGKNEQQWLAENGVTYSDESEGVERQFWRDRLFYDPDISDDRLMTHHIKMFGDDIRIHLCWSRDEGRFLVGYIGEHLRTVRDPT